MVLAHQKGDANPDFPGSKLICCVTRSSTNPIQQEKGAHEEREHSIQCVTHGVRMPVNCAKDS
jgi:hypothetical protein